MSIETLVLFIFGGVFVAIGLLFGFTAGWGSVECVMGLAAGLIMAIIGFVQYYKEKHGIKAVK